MTKVKKTAKKTTAASAGKSAKLWEFKDFLSMKEIGSEELDMLFKLAEKTA